MHIRGAVRLARGWPPIRFGQGYWSELRLRRSLLLWLGVGLALRMLVMPFTAHSDYLDSHWRSEQMAERRIPYPTRTQFLSHAADAAWLVLMTPLLPDRAALFAAPPSQHGRLDADPTTFGRFVAQPGVWRALFVTKLIYLLVDLAAGLALLGLFATAAQGLLAFRLWMLNPAVLFAVFIYGRYEVYALFALVLSLVLARHERPLLATLLLGCAIAFRATPILLLPIYALTLARSWPRRAGLLLAGLAPQLLIVLVMERLRHYIPAYNVDHPTGPLSGLVNSALSPFSIFPFVFGYVLLLLWLDRRSGGLDMLVRACMAVYLLLYMLTWHSAHYISWLAPFVVPLIAWGRLSARLYLLLLLAWALYWLTASDGGVFTTYLLSPLYGRAGVPPPPGLLIAARLHALQLDQAQLITAARSLLAAVACWMLLQLRPAPAAPEPDAQR